VSALESFALSVESRQNMTSGFGWLIVWRDMRGWVMYEIPSNTFHSRRYAIFTTSQPASACAYHPGLSMIAMEWHPSTTAPFITQITLTCHDTDVCKGFCYKRCNHIVLQNANTWVQICTRRSIQELIPSFRVQMCSRHLIPSS
jgi:hypothetical protein